MAIVADTGGLYALYDGNDRDHATVSEAVSKKSGESSTFRL